MNGERVGARWTRITLAAACLAGIAFLLGQILCFGYGRDQGIYAMVARSMLDGGMPYRDAWDFKPPGIFVVYAIARALIGSGQHGIRVVEAVGLALTAAGMVQLGKRWFGDPLVGLLAAAIAILVHAQLDFWHTAQPESFGGMLTIAALLAADRARGLAAERDGCAPDARASAWLVAAGACFGAAGLLKPPLAGGGAIVAVWWAWHALQTAPSRGAGIWASVRAACVLALGGALPVAICLGWFAARGALGDLVQVLFVFTPHYTKLSWEGAAFWGMVWWGVNEWFTTYSSVTAVGMLLLIAFRPERAEVALVLLLLGIVAVHVAGVVMQGKFFPYHYGATWPPTALLAALGYWKLWKRLVCRGPAGVAAFFTAFTIVALGRSATKDVPGSFMQRSMERVRLFVLGPRDQEAIDRLASVADVNAVANRKVAELLAARVPAGQPVFVWGFEPVIYDLADRPPSTRFLYDVPQRVEWARREMQERLMADLAARPPAAIVVEHRDVFPMVTGDTLDSADSLRYFPELVRLLEERYELGATIEDFDVHFLSAPTERPAG